MSNLHEIMDRAKAFAETNLQECAAELIEWNDTALLRDGKVRELARIFEAVDATHALTLAEREVQHAALAQAARASTPERAAVTEGEQYETWLRGERSRRCDFDANAASWARAAWQAAHAFMPERKAVTDAAWQTGTPPVPEGKSREFIIAVRRAQSKPAGRVFVFSANYANNFTDDGCLSDRSGDEFTAHGWHLCGLDMSGEFNEVYEPIGLGDGDEIVGWKELPEWNDAILATTASDSATPKETGEAK